MSVKGEKYTSAAAKRKHEKVEGPMDRMKEYGAKKAVKAKAKAKVKAKKK